MANLPFPPNQPVANPQQPQQQEQPWPARFMAHAVAMGETVKALCMYLFWILVGATALSGFYVAIRLIWIIIQQVLDALGVETYGRR